jgi:hypothetical protein
VAPSAAPPSGRAGGASRPICPCATSTLFNSVELRCCKSNQTPRLRHVCDQIAVLACSLRGADVVMEIGTPRAHARRAHLRPDEGKIPNADPRAHDRELASRSEAGRPSKCFQLLLARGSRVRRPIRHQLRHASTGFVLNSLQRSKYLGNDLIVIFVQPL